MYYFPSTLQLHTSFFGLCRKYQWSTYVVARQNKRTYKVPFQGTIYYKLTSLFYKEIEKQIHSQIKEIYQFSWNSSLFRKKVSEKVKKILDSWKKAIEVKRSVKLDETKKNIKINLFSISPFFGINCLLYYTLSASAFTELKGHLSVWSK